MDITVKADMITQSNELSKKLKRLFDATWLNDKEIKKMLATASVPMEKQLQQDYLSADPSGMSGRMVNYVTIKSKGKKFGTIYIGPDTKISKGWQLWWLLDKGFTHKRKSTKKGGTTITVVAGKHFSRKAFMKTEKLVAENAIQEFEKELKKQAKKEGLDVK